MARELDMLAGEFLESVPDMVYVIDLDGQLLSWNERAAEVTGYDETELAEMTAFELLHPDQRTAAADALDRIGSFPPERTFEFDLTAKDGERIACEFNGSVLERADRSVAVVVARDVTSRRERESEIRRQRDELETLNSISETVYGMVLSVVDAASRAEIESNVCKRLAASDFYEAVWLGRSDPRGTIEPSRGVGTTEDFVETVAELNELEWTRPAKAAFESGEVRTVQRIPESQLPKEAREAATRLGIRSGIAVPVVHRGTVEGVLCVYSSRAKAFGERERAAFERLGEVVGFAINAVRNERLLLSDDVTELTFRVSSRDAFLASLSTMADGPCRLEWSTPVGSDEGNYRHYVTVSGLDPERVREVARETDEVVSVDHVGDNDSNHVFSVVTTDSFARQLLDAGVAPSTVVARDGETTVVAELPSETDARPVVEAAGDQYDAELVSKRQVERPERTTDDFYDAVAERLTDRQRAALRHAHLGGYFDWPREATAEEIAARMEVSSPTFHYHIRHAQRALTEAFLDHLGH